MTNTGDIKRLLRKAQDLIAAIDGTTDQFDEEVAALYRAIAQVEATLPSGVAALSPKQRRVLATIQAMHSEGFDVIRPGPLATRGGWKGSFDIGSALDKLELFGFIRRIRHGRRHTEIVLTERGEKARAP